MNEPEHEAHGGSFSAEETAAIRARVAVWWNQRQELRQDNAWDVPFPLREGCTARVTLEREADASADEGLWRAALMHLRARSAFIEVESRVGPLPALTNLYQHLV